MAAFLASAKEKLAWRKLNVRLYKINLLLSVVQISTRCRFGDCGQMLWFSGNASEFA
jgi:hypothetical protein